MKKIHLALGFLLCLAHPALAADTDIYGVSTINVKPNVLIIFDNSGSMGTQDIPSHIYDPNTTYAGTATSNAVYRLSGGNYNTLYFADINSANWQCAAAKTSLKTLGYYQGNLTVSGSGSSAVVTCGGTNRTLRLGNFRNFDALGYAIKFTRMEVAKKVIAQLIYDNYNDVRFGLMKFNAQTPLTYYGSTADKEYESGYIMAVPGASQATLIGSYTPTTVFTDNDQSATFGQIGGMYSDTYTPLAETLAEAGLFYAGQQSWYNGTATGTGYPVGKFSATCAASNTGCQDYSTSTPIQYRCQKNYIIIMTDGDPTLDNNPKLANNAYINGTKIPAAGHDGLADYLDDVAYFLAHNDLLPTMGSAGDFQNQTVTTYTIGFTTNNTLLQNTATNGGGQYYTAANASSLGEALNNIISDIKANNEGFSAAAVPVSRANKAYAGNFVYYGLFQPLNTGNWVGNLKKYGITDLGVIQDKNGMAAISGGVVADNATSYWSTIVDGPSVIKGGAGEKLTNDLAAGVVRKIYTYTGTTSTLTNVANNFVTTNAALNTTTYPGLTASVITAVRHDTTDTWPLGSLLHSQPLVVHYDDNNDGVDDHSMIYVGANDGMLHCFDDNDGAEKWGFVPRDLLDDLAPLVAPTALHYYVDGSPVLYTYDHDGNPATPNKKMIIVGERRGGYHYTALDISDYNAPLLQYEVAPSILGGGTKYLGQSWGKPQACEMVDHLDINGDPVPKDVFFMAGGYDDNQDSSTPAATDSKGKAVFAIDSQTGALFPNFNFNGDNFSSMTHSIVAAVGYENPSTRTTTRAYAGDLHGNLFAFRDDIFHLNQDKAKKGCFAGQYNGQEDGTWGQKLKLYSSPGKKIFYAPTVLNEFFPVKFSYCSQPNPDTLNCSGTPAPTCAPTDLLQKTENRIGDYVFYGTGDREHPNETATTNAFYAIKNSWQWEDNSATPGIDESIFPAIIEAYVDATDGMVKSKADNSVIVGTQRDAQGDKILGVPGTGLFILDVTDDLIQNTQSVAATRKLYSNYVSDAIDHPNNRGWFIRLVEADGSSVGEKVVSSPIIFGGVIYFTTYIPDSGAVVVDPCANPGAKGAGYLYAIGYKHGEAVQDYDTSNNDQNSGDKHRGDRRKKLGTPGIPPEPVLVVHEGKPTIITGFTTENPVFRQSVEVFYWRQIDR